jgi:hypothetical protein
MATTRDSLFELLGRSRENVLSKRPTIPPPGTLARPGQAQAPAVKGVAASEPKPSARFAGAPVAVLERAIDELLDVDGDPLLVIDDELDVSAITPEDGLVDEPPTRLLGVRADTAVVFGIGLVLVIAIAYLAGRTTKVPAGEATKAAPVATPKPIVPPNALDTPASDDAPAAPPVAAPVKAEAPAKVEAPAKTAADTGIELWVVTTSEAKANDVARFLNESMMSPLSGQTGLKAYVKNGSRGDQVRIKGFATMDPKVLAGVKEMHDPTGGGGFDTASYHTISSKKR